ncbi:uncharacterized protein LOC124795626 [Schistocerca piceifrons]|uniref:uncharacterized protein LOC124795626 n=1 Tax=Schistocerca piceifrons TaxID=274613 RepID=UPI001F5F828D|nr:uncharacterized protein LOC124795626 [Schistocerca piceifrons]
MVQFAQEHKLKITNTVFSKNQNQRWTWRSPGGRTKNEIDYILMEEQNIIKNVQRQIQIRTTEATTSSKCQYKTKHSRNVNALEKCIYQAHKDTSKDEQMNKSRSKLSQNRNKEEYAKQDKITKREIRKDIPKHRSAITRQTLETNKSIKKARISAQRGKKWILGTKNQGGEHLNTKEDTNKSATEFYKAIHTSSLPNKATDRNPDDPDPNTTEIIPTIIHSEVRTTITELKNR